MKTDPVTHKPFEYKNNAVRKSERIQSEQGSSPYQIRAAVIESTGMWFGHFNGQRYRGKCLPYQSLLGKTRAAKHNIGNDVPHPPWCRSFSLSSFLNELTQFPQISLTSSFSAFSGTKEERTMDSRLLKPSGSPWLRPSSALLQM